MQRWGRVGRRLALATGALGAAAALVGAASFALFTSTAQPQQDSFAAGTVILGRDTPPADCQISNIEPGDSGTCQYQVTYSGSLNAWLALDVAATSTATAVYTPQNSVTPLGGEALLSDQSSDSGAPQVSLTDARGGSFTVPAVACQPFSDSTTPGTAEGAPPVWQPYLLCSGGAYNQFVGGPVTTTTNDAPAGSWANGQSDTFTLHWHLPLASPNTYQGSTATIVLRAHAVQASNNPAAGGTPSQGWTMASGFETPHLPGPNEVFFFAGQSMGPWTVTSGSVDLNPSTVWQPVQGSQSLDLSGNGPGTVAQTLPTTPGQNYTLRFALSGNPYCGPAVKTLNVLWGGGVVASPTFDTSGITPQNMGWTYHSYVVQASGSSTQLAFQSTTNSSCGPVLDDVSIAPAP